MNLSYKLTIDILLQEVKLSFKDFLKLNLFKSFNKSGDLNIILQQFYLSFLILFISIFICVFLKNFNFTNNEIIYIFNVIMAGFVLFELLYLVFVFIDLILNISSIFMEIVFLEKIIQTKEFYKKQHNYFEKLKNSLLVLQKTLSYNYNKTIIEFLIKQNFISKEEKDKIINGKEKWKSYELLEEIIKFVHQENNKKSFKRDENVLQQFKKSLLCKLNIIQQILEIKNKKEFENKSSYERIISIIKDFYFLNKDEGLQLIFLTLNLFIITTIILSFIHSDINIFISICLIIFTLFLLLYIKTKAIIYAFNITREEIKKLNLNEEKDLNGCVKYFELCLNLKEKEKIVKDLLSLNNITIEKLQQATSTNKIEELRELNVTYNDKLREIFKLVLLKNKKTKSKYENKIKEKSEEEKLNNKIKELKKELTETSFVDEIKKL